MPIDHLLSTLTLQEKAALLQGATQWNTHAFPRHGIPAMFLSDGPHGLCKQAATDDLLWSGREITPATCFPTASAMANTWNTALGEELGRALGEEAAANGVHVVLGPGLNIKRSPLCGRNFEYFSEDPYLAGKLAAAYVRGIQSNGVAACCKHFAVNSQELRRMSSDSVLDERTLRELYLTAFEITVREGRPRSIMSSYNRINGTYANENRHLLQDILRRDWDFDGFVVTDWGADNDHAAGVAAGSALMMPAPGADAALALCEAVAAGQLSEADMDARLRELLAVVFSTHKAVAQAPDHYDAAAHHALARRCAAESIVLLENDGILPLAADASVAIIGEFAAKPRYQGAGSSLVNPTRLDDLCTCAAAAGMSVAGYAAGYRRNAPQPDAALLAEAAALAAKADVVLLCVGLDETTESEGMDRRDLHLAAGHYALIEAVANANPNVVLVLSGGAPFLMPPQGQYRAAIHGYLGGQAGAAAMVDALRGIVNPCGKLSETWPLRPEDTPCHDSYPAAGDAALYREGLYVGYRCYDTANLPVRYPFGHGMSYTTFAYSDIAADAQGVSFTLTNTGIVDGAEVAQVYVSCPDGQVFRPKKELKGFAKVFLAAGERRRVHIPFDDKAFRYWNVKTDRFEVEGGTYTIAVAASCADVRLEAAVTIHDSGAPLPYGSLPHYERGDVHHVSDEEFAALLGRALPEITPHTTLELNDPLSQLQFVPTLPAKLTFSILRRWKEKGEKRIPPDLTPMFIYNMSLRSIAKLTGGRFSRDMVEDLRLMFNGHFFRGAFRLLGHHRRNKAAARDFAALWEETT